MKQNNKKKIIAAVIAAMMLISLMISCEKEIAPTNEEVIEEAKVLLEDAVEVNRIFFWEGLPHAEPAGDGIDLGDSEYLNLTEEYMYLSESDLMTKAEAVYTKQYCNDIKTIAFEGIKINENEALFARYIVEADVMKINRKLSEEGLSERIPELDTIQVIEAKAKEAIVSVSFTCNGETEKQNVTMRLEDNGWRLDTPTY